MPNVYNWQLGRDMLYPYEAKYPEQQFAFVFNINRCIACQTCTMACKATWTFSKGQEYMWWNNVETKPYGGYPQNWDVKILQLMEKANPGGQTWNSSPHRHQDPGSPLAGVRDAARKFLVEHLAAWAVSFAERLARKAQAVVPPDGGFYGALSACLNALMRDELRCSQLTPESIGSVEPVRADFEPEGCSFVCGPVGEPVLANLPGFNV